MGKVLIIKGADFFANAIKKIVIDDKISIIGEVTPTGGGVVNGGGRYNIGDIVTLTAVANTGYGFVKWSDGITTETRNITVGQTDKVYTAEFAKTSDIDFNLSAGYYNSGGLRNAPIPNYVCTDFLSTSGTGSKNILEAGEKIYVKCQADANVGNFTVFITDYDSNPSLYKTVTKTYTSNETKDGLTITATEKCEVYINNLTTLEPNPIARYTI